MRDYRKLKAFVAADELVFVIYKTTSAFPDSERYGLTTQLRRAVVSIGSNIVEGSTRASQRDYRRFVEIAYGSAAEVAYQFSVAERLGFVSSLEDVTVTRRRIEETVNLLGGLVRFLDTDPPSPRSKVESQKS